MAETSNDGRGAPSQRRYPPELRERAARMVQRPSRSPASASGWSSGWRGRSAFGTESLRSWVRQAEIDGSQRPGTCTQDQERIVTSDLRICRPYRQQEERER